MPLLTGGEILAEYLVKEGVPYAVGIPGHGCMGIVDAFAERRDRIGVIQVRHEQSACHLADGYYRVSGRPLAVFTSIGPGACNTVVGVATAYVDSSALILFTGSVHTYSFGTGVLQEIERKRWADFPSIIQPVVKRSWQITRVDQLPRVLPHAFNLALTGRPGPVHIDMPMDIQAEVAAERTAWRAELDQWAAGPSRLMHPRAFLRELAAALPNQAIVTTDVGNTCSMCNSYFGFVQGRRYLAPLSWGNCGIAYGLALGAKAGRPDLPVFALQGDGAYGISGLSEVMTAVR